MDIADNCGQLQILQIIADCEHCEQLWILQTIADIVVNCGQLQNFPQCCNILFVISIFGHE
jgi:hypothetical protein